MVGILMKRRTVGGKLGEVCIGWVEVAMAIFVVVVYFLWSKSNWRCPKNSDFKNATPVQTLACLL